MITIIILIFLSCNINSFAIINRIVSLGPIITEELYILGSGEKIVGNTIYCQKPEPAKYKEKVGTIIEHDVEKIVSLKPDIVFATSLTNPNTIEKLKYLKIKVVRFSYAKSFDELCSQLLDLGKYIGKEEIAKNIINDIRKKVKNIRNKTKKLKKPKVVVQVGSNPLWLAIKESYINDLIEFAGGLNIGPSGKSGLYSREKLVKQDPDIIIICEMGVKGEEEKKEWQKYKSMSAVKHNRIYIIDSYKIGSTTPVSFLEVLNDFVKILHPELEQ